MRFLSAILIWILFVGGVWLYTRDRGRVGISARSAQEDHTVEESFVLEVTPTFDGEEDPFALQSTNNSAGSMEIRLNGSPLVLPAQFANQFRRGQVFRIEHVQGIVKGYNELYVHALPPLSESMLAHGVRLRLCAVSRCIADSTLWSGHGVPVSDSFGFQYDEKQGAEDGHAE